MWTEHREIIGDILGNTVPSVSRRSLDLKINRARGKFIRALFFTGRRLIVDKEELQAQRVGYSFFFSLRIVAPLHANFSRAGRDRGGAINRAGRIIERKGKASCTLPGARKKRAFPDERRPSLEDIAFAGR